ncbi:Peptidase S49 [Aureococcus anophagefferens]|uniref:Peptidase S49 n=1 Tax=Aureococcus anophagefferens TaxID=44056 RepID=A0ABR1G0K6_AURAN
MAHRSCARAAVLALLAAAGARAVRGPRSVATLPSWRRDGARSRAGAAPAAVFRFVAPPGEAPPEVLAFVDEICTSGGYFAACAADDIVATPCALLGSIGVISRSFGYQRQLRKIGVERRVLAAGAAKAGLDPYLPQSRPGIAREKRVLEELHDEFVATTALELGLVDKVVDETFTEALKQRYGQRIFLKKLATNPPTGLGALPLGAPA